MNEVFILNACTFIFIAAPRVTQLEGNVCEIAWEMVAPMKGDPVGYILQVLVGRESEYKQVGKRSQLSCLIDGNRNSFDHSLGCCFLLH